MTANRPIDARIAFIGFVVVLVISWFCYRPALSGAFQLDDVSNLSGLAYIEDADSLVNFALSGQAGPVGRPLALLSFALQADQWEHGAAAFLQFNLLLHLLNAVILAWCLYQLALLTSTDRRRAALIAAAAASIWVTLPLLASSSLLVIQRMTTLSAFFTLLGLGAYLLARRRLPGMPARALTGMGASLVAGTLLATLCKESGLLLPAFVLVLEATVLGRPEAVLQRQWRIFQAVFLVLPVVVILAFLITRLPHPDWLVARRDFNAWERMLTESRILWSYLAKALAGFPSQLGIYQTPPTVSRSLLEPATLLACVSWLGLAVTAVIWRRRAPFMALAVLWFLAGHAIESTFVSLELYFEHRNYLPLVGPVFAICAWLIARSDYSRRIAFVVIPLFIVANAWFLHGFASLWGDPSPAARYWAQQYPDSVRAVTTMASFQLVEEGPLSTLATLDRFVAANPQHAYLRIQELNLRCLTMPEEDHAAVLQQLETGLPAVDFTYTAGTMLSELFTTAANADCRGINVDTVTSLASILRSNPRYVGDPAYNQFHYKLLAGISRYQGDNDAALDHLRTAIAYRPSAELNMMMVTLLGGTGDFDAAHAYIEEALLEAPRNPLRAFVWRRELENLREYVVELERYSQPESQSDPGTETEAP